MRDTDGAISRRVERGAAHVRKILDEVAQKHSISIELLKVKKRVTFLVRPRQEAMYRAVMETSASLPIIGREMERHHTTVLNGFRRHAARVGAAHLIHRL